jgi:hypothetical protein
MAPPTRTPGSEWIRQALRALAGGGPDAVRIEPLAKELGVSRGGFARAMTAKTLDDVFAGPQENGPRP